MIVNEYETTIILKPEMPEEESKRVIERLDGVIANYKGSILAFEDWGVRKLAYSIAKNTRGRYLNWYFVAEPACILELERIIRIESDIVRFLTVRLGIQVDVEELREKAKERKRRFADESSESQDDDDTFDTPFGGDDHGEPDND